ncbi:MAG: TIGR03643 family protein [Gammaproteobacteria bacterium]
MKTDYALLNIEDKSRIVEMAWEDRTPFEAIQSTFGLAEGDVISLMRRELKPGSFLLWRERVTARKTKHAALRQDSVNRGYCSTQYKAPQYRASRHKSSQNRSR